MATTRTIKTTIALDGEKAFNNAMKEVNSNLRALKAELKASESAFSTQGKSVSTLTANQKALQAAYDQSKAKVAALEKAVKESADKYGDNAKTTDELRTSLGKAKAEMNNFKAALKRNSEELNKARAAEEEYAGGMENVASAAESSTAALNTRSVALGNILANLAQKGAELLKTTAQTGIQYNAQLESYTMAMKTALGSTEAAAKAIENIKIDAAITPYSVDTLVRANQFLISTGESAENARATIMALSDAVSAVGGGNDELLRMAQNLQQIKNAGKAAAVDIKQFAYAGIDIYGVLADYTGKTTAEVKALEVSYDLLSKALQAAATEGGRFYGANAAQAATLNGQISTLQDNIKSKLGEAFAGASNILSGTLLPAANSFVSSLDMGKIVEGFDELITVAAAAGGAIAALQVAGKVSSFVQNLSEVVKYTAALEKGADAAAIAQMALQGKLTATEVIAGVYSGTIEMATVKQMALNAATKAFPAVAFVAGVTAIVAGIKSLNDEAQKSAETLVESVKASDNIDEVKSKLDELTEQYKTMKAEFESGYSDYNFFDVKAMERTVEEIKAYYEELAAAEEAAATPAAKLESAMSTFQEKAEGLMQTYVDVYNAAYESISGQFGLFETLSTEVSLSTEEMIAALTSQSDYMNVYAENLRKAAEYGISDGLVAALSDGSTQSAGYLQAIVSEIEAAGGAASEGGKEIAESLNSAFSAQQASMETYATAVADTRTNIESTMQDLVNSTAETVADLDMAEEAQASANNTINGYIAGIESNSGALIERMSALGASALAAFNAALEIRSPSRAMKRSAQFTAKGYIEEIKAQQATVEKTMTAMGESALKGFNTRLSLGVDGINTENSGKKVSSGRPLVMNLYPQAIDKATVDYLVRKVDEELGKK